MTSGPKTKNRILYSWLPNLPGTEVGEKPEVPLLGFPEQELC